MRTEQDMTEQNRREFGKCKAVNGEVGDIYQTYVERQRPVMM